MSAAPHADLLFPIVRDALGPRLALVFGNHAPEGLCPFYRAALCHHCDIGAGEGARCDVATNRARLAWFRARYAAELPSIAHLVLYNSGSVLNPQEMPPELLLGVLAFARALPALAAVSVDSRETYVTEDRVLAAAGALGPGKTFRVIVGLESADDAIRDGLLEKRMPRAAIERAVRALGKAAREAAIGLSMNVVVGGPGAAGPRAVADARASARYALDLAAREGLPLELNLHPYYPSERGRARFPDHPRPSLADVVAAAEAVCAEAARGARATIFLGLHDEGHDRRPEERAAAVRPLARALEEFHRTQDAGALRAILSAG